MNPAPAAPAPSRLRRLPGRSPSLGLSRAMPRTRLWIGDQELVQETVRAYTQEIQRFALADLQSIQIRRTTRGMVYNIVLIALAALAVLLVWSIWRTSERNLQLTGGQLGVLAGVAAPFVLLLLVNSLRGATCRTVLSTALGPQHLPSLSRMRPARRALTAIIAGVDAAQGTLPPGEAAPSIDQAQAQPRPPGAPLP